MSASTEIVPRLLVADADAVRKFGDFVKYFPFSSAMPNWPLPRPASTSSEVLPQDAIFEIGDQRRRVHGDSSDKAAFHQIDQNRPKTT